MLYALISKWSHSPISMRYHLLEGDAEDRDEKADVELDDNINAGADKSEDSDVKADEEVGGNTDNSIHQGSNDLTV